MNLRLTMLMSILIALFTGTAHAQSFDQPELGNIVTVEGVVQEIINAESFLMQQTEPFDFSPSEVVVFNDDSDPFATDVNVGTTVEVTGRVTELVMNDVSADIDYNLDTTVYDAYNPDDYAIVASLVTDPITDVMAGDFDYDPTLAFEIQNNPTPYIGDTFTVEGYVSNILGPYSFELTETEPFNLSPDALIILNDDTEPFATDVNMGRHVRVTGQFQDFDLMTVDQFTDYSLDPNVYTSYGIDDYALVAELVTATGARTTDTEYLRADVEVEGTTTDVTIDDLEHNPLVYVGQTVNVEGEVEAIYDDQTFLLEEDEFFDLHPLQIPVFADSEVNYANDPGDLTDIVDDDLYSVQGEVIAFDLVEIETRLGYALDPDLYVDFDSDNIAIIATNVVQIEN